MEDASSRYVAGQAAAGDAWAGEAAESGRRGTQRITAAGWRDATPEIAAALGIPPGGQVAARRRLILLDDQPIEVADAYYPPTVATGAGAALAEPGKIKGGSAALLAELGHVARQVRETVGARLPDAEEQETLGITATQPVLVLKRTLSDRSGAPFEYTVMVMNAAGRELHYDSQSG